MPYVRILVHTVWSTKNRKKYLTKGTKDILIEHIKENAILKGIHILAIDGHDEHIHCLISMNSDQNMATIINLIKGESSFWINKNKLLESHFGWQDEYFAVSIGESQVEKVVNYINNQEIHHQKKSFLKEYDEFIQKYGFEKIKD